MPVNTYQYIDSDEAIQTVDMTPEQRSADSDHRVFLSTNAEFITNEKFKRTLLLTASDWTQVGDMPSSIKTPYVAYRQALRDLPTHSNWPLLDSSDWPSLPEV